MSRFRSHLLTLCLALYYFHQVFNADAYDDDAYISKYYYRKGDAESKMRNMPEPIRSGKGKGIIGKFGKYKAESEPSTIKRGLFKAAEFEEPKTEATPKTSPQTEKAPRLLAKASPQTEKTPRLLAKAAPAKQNETEAEKAERIHRTFEKLLTFVEIVGQVDNYVSTKWKNLVRTVSNLYDEEDEEDYRLGLKKFKSCPAFIKET